MPENKKIKLEDINGKRFSLVIWNADNEDDVRVFPGIAKYANNKLTLERESGAIPIQDEWLNRIKEIKDKEMSEILQDAEYSLSLTIGNLPTNGDVSEFIKLPIKWE